MAEKISRECDKKGCGKPVRITVTVWAQDASGTGAQMEFCDDHIGDISKIVLTIQKVTHE